MMVGAPEHLLADGCIWSMVLLATQCNYEQPACTTCLLRVPLLHLKQKALQLGLSSCKIPLRCVPEALDDRWKCWGLPSKPQDILTLLERPQTQRWLKQTIAFPGPCSILAMNQCTFTGRHPGCIDTLACYGGRPCRGNRL